MSPEKDEKAETSGRGSNGRKSTKLNIFVGSTPPPGTISFNADGTISKTSDSPELRLEWIVQKMTRKIEQEPDDGEWYFERGNALMALGRYTNAIPDFSKLIDIYAKFGDYYRFRGLCYFYLGDQTHALEDLRSYKQFWSHKFDAEALKILEELEYI